MISAASDSFCICCCSFVTGLLLIVFLRYINDSWFCFLQKNINSFFLIFLGLTACLLKLVFLALWLWTIILIIHVFYAVCASQLVYVGWSYLWWLQVFCWGEEGRKARGTFQRLIILFKLELCCLQKLISTWHMMTWLVRESRNSLLKMKCYLLCYENYAVCLNLCGTCVNCSWILFLIQWGWDLWILEI